MRFPALLTRLHVFASYSDWFIALFVPVVICQTTIVTLVLVLRHSVESRSNESMFTLRSYLGFCLSISAGIVNRGTGYETLP